MSTSAQYPRIVLKSLAATASLAAALITGQVLTDAPAAATQLQATSCPQDTHWSDATQACVADTHWVVVTDLTR